MSRTTPPCPVDMAEWFPQVLPYARDATRLHPRPHTVGARDSSVGGPVLWPNDEPWPYCTEDHDQIDGAPVNPVPLVPILQLFAADMPSLPFPAGCDVFQLLWCPFIHEPQNSMLPSLVWRSSADVREPRTEFPFPDEGMDFIRRHIPLPCAVHPEAVVEYPSWDLPSAVSTAIGPAFHRLEALTEWEYDSHLSVAPGIKVGGYPLWTQSPDWPDCQECGRRMDHLVTIPSGEGLDSNARWLPMEEQHLLSPSASDEERERVWEGAGLMLGDCGGVYVFICPSCPGLPFQHRYDC